VDVVGIIQARTNSTRLPGKTLLDICGKPMLWRVIERVNQSQHINQTVVAIPERDRGSFLECAASWKARVYIGGEENDVLTRYYEAAKEYNATVAVRITGDCPLIDPDIIDQAIEEFIHTASDYCSTTPSWITGFPDGMDVEVFSFDVLEMACEESKTAEEREHVTMYMRENCERIQSVYYNGPMKYGGGLKWSVDNQEDLELVREVYAGIGKDVFSMSEVIECLTPTPAK